jgi:hypothetical protein
MLRRNPHFHAGCLAEQRFVRIATRPIVLEGGFDDEGTFFFILFPGLQSMVEVFRHRVVKLLVDRELLNEGFARNLLSWKRSGFSRHAWASSERSERPADLPEEDPLRAV